MEENKLKIYMKSIKANYEATAEYEDGKVIIKSGSRIRKCNKNYNRPKLFQLIRDDCTKVKDYMLVEDITFNSPSTAASFVADTSKNGLIYWRDKNNTKLKEILGGKKSGKK